MLLFLCPTSLVWAQNISATDAEKYCRIFAETPEKFQKLESFPCEIFRHKNSIEKNEETCFKYNNQTYVGRFDGGTCGSSGIYLLEKDENKEYGVHMPIANITVNGYRMDLYDQLFSYNDTLFVSGGDDLRIVENDKQYVLCQLFYEFQGYDKPENEDPICQDLENKNYNEIAAAPVDIVEAKKLGWDVPKLRGASLKPFAHTNVDIDNDSINEDVFYYSFSSGAGCGCDYHSLAVFPNAKGININNRCGAFKTIIAEINQTPYILQTFKDSGRKHNRYFSKKAHIPNQSLYKIEDNQTVKICEQKPILKRVIDKDFLGDQLNSRHHTYLPIK